MPVQYPGAVKDPDTGALISDAEVAEIAYTAFADTPQEVTARLVVRRVRDANTQDALFPVWRYHPFFTNTTEPVAQADITHRQHAIIETVFADLIDGPLAHQPSGSFAANTAWAVLAAITHNLLRAAGTLAGNAIGVARGATLRRHLVNVPARFARPQRRPTLHLPTHWPRATAWNMLWHSVFHRRHRSSRGLTPPTPARTGHNRKHQWTRWSRPADPPRPHPGRPAGTPDRARTKINKSVNLRIQAKRWHSPQAPRGRDVASHQQSVAGGRVAPTTVTRQPDYPSGGAVRKPIPLRDGLVGPVL